MLDVLPDSELYEPAEHKVGEVAIVEGQNPPLGQSKQEEGSVPPPEGLKVPRGQGTGSKHRPKHQCPGGHVKHLLQPPMSLGGGAKRSDGDLSAHTLVVATQLHVPRAQPTTGFPSTTLLIFLSQVGPQQQHGSTANKARFEPPYVPGGQSNCVTGMGVAVISG